MTAMPIDPDLPRQLIVDDEPAIQRFLKTALESDEFTLFQAETGRAALSAAVSVKPESSCSTWVCRTWTELRLSAGYGNGRRFPSSSSQYGTGKPRRSRP
jgi:PleD family two-component response regulator